MAEDTTVLDDDIQDVSLIDPPADVQTDTPSEPAEEAKDDGADTQDKPEEQSDEAKDTEATEPEAQTEEANAEEKPDAEAARQAYQNRARTRQQVAQNIDEHYAPKSQEDFMAEGLSEQDARIQAMEARMEYSEQRAQVAELNAAMQSDAVNVINDFPVFNPKSPDYDPEFAQLVEQQYQQASRLQVDEYGNVLNAEVPLYDFHQRMAQIYGRGASRGTQQAQSDANQMLARTENPGGSSSTNAPDPGSLEEMEERLGDVVIT